MPLTIPDQSIATQIQVPNGVGTIGGLMNMANGALTLRKNTATLDADIARSKALSQSAQATAQVDTANVQPLIQAQQAATDTAQTGAKSAQFKLSNDYAGVANQTATGLLADPRITGPNYSEEAATQALVEAQEAMVAKGVPKAQAAIATAPFINAIHQPGKVAQMLKNTLVGNLGGAAQQTALTPSGVAVGNGIQTGVINTNPLAAGGVGAAIPGTTQTQMVPLEKQQAIGADVAGNPIVVRKDAMGNILGMSGMPAPVAAPGQPAPLTNLPPGDAAMLPKMAEQRMAINNAAAKVPEQHASNQQLLQLLDKGGLDPTGPGAQAAAQFFGHIGVPFGTDYATNLQRIAHLTAMQTQANEAGMGVKTDAGRATSELATGGVGMTPEALKAAIKLNDATSTGLEMFNKGMEQAAQNSPKGNLAVRDFQNDWSKVYSPTVMRLHNAVQAGDQSEVQQVLKQVAGNFKGPVNQAPGVKDLLNRAKALDSLSQTGRLQ